MDKEKNKRSDLTDPDVQTLDAVIKTLYGSISFRPGEKSDLDRLKKLFVVSGHVITPELPNSSSVIVSIDEYISLFEENMEKSGRRHEGFFEHELGRRTDVFGNMAHVLSAFESKCTPNDKQSRSRGINSIQLIRKEGRWWIVSITWDYERGENPLPQKFNPGDQW